MTNVAPATAIHFLGAENIPAGGAEYVALGDSYAGNPTTKQQYEQLPTDQKCRHGENSYPVHIAPYFRSFANYTCSGAVIEKDTDAQPRISNMAMLLDAAERDGALGPQTKIVTLTIGGNEAWIGFRDYGLFGSPEIVTPDEYQRRLAASMDRIHQLAPHARVLLVGYPEYVGADNLNCLVDTNRFGFPIRIAVPAAGQRIYLLALNDAMKITAPLMGAEYVDIYTGSIGHGSCAPDSMRYIKTILDAPERDKYLPLHLNEAGTKYQAETILKFLGIQQR
ncbi:SGNH/GDSL hydrolase family protein [Corynebacterium sp. HS2168-gen11]|uniref:SGNH/GDSL hydrolase family protein n=1 Tax=Corynebacterium sp. HS2168-gen11 TaxID=2974027 RepID=UPI00216B1E78|nr:SGNH/GDSL hydrolase family protein [Corynebacterium sp. HS2168-gen11]MCS4536206.1 SGNH/GDSL hydrolase family protein [Corynebacterium sp. HS2168-gen11]